MSWGYLMLVKLAWKFLVLRCHFLAFNICKYARSRLPERGIDDFFFWNFGRALGNLRSVLEGLFVTKCCRIVVYFEVMLSHRDSVRNGSDACLEDNNCGRLSTVRKYGWAIDGSIWVPKLVGSCSVMLFETNGSLFSSLSLKRDNKFKSTCGIVSFFC